MFLIRYVSDNLDRLRGNTIFWTLKQIWLIRQLSNLDLIIFFHGTCASFLFSCISFIKVLIFILIGAFAIQSSDYSPWQQGCHAVSSLIANPQCGIKVLLLNNCQLGLAGVAQIIQAIAGCNIKAKFVYEAQNGQLFFINIEFFINQVTTILKNSIWLITLILINIPCNVT